MLRMAYFLIALFLFSCSSKNKIDTRLLIPDDKLVPVLVDLHLVYALQTTSEFRSIANRYDSIDVHSDIFMKHDITRVQLDSTLAYLSRNPQELLEIYDEVIMQLNQMQDTIPYP